VTQRAVGFFQISLMPFVRLEKMFYFSSVFGAGTYDSTGFLSFTNSNAAMPTKSELKPEI